MNMKKKLLPQLDKLYSTMKTVIVTAAITTTANNYSHIITAEAALSDITEPHIELLPVKYEPPLGLKTALNKKEIRCLAKNIYEEAQRGNITDRVSSGYGVVNRVKDPRFPNTICGVVYQKGAMSWTKSAAKRKRGHSEAAEKVAIDILNGKVKNPSPDCPYTQWYNVKLDSKRSFNYKKMMDIKSCTYKPFDTPHYYIAYRS